MSVDARRVEWVWQTWRGRGLAWMILLLVGVIVCIVTYGGLRSTYVGFVPPVVTKVAGWLPSYLSAFGLPFMWPALGRRVLGHPGPVEYLPECMVSGGTVLILEALDATSMGAVFAWADVVAGVGGTLTAFLAYRLIVRGRPNAVESRA